jgi:hypothetical protein
MFHIVTFVPNRPINVQRIQEVALAPAHSWFRFSPTSWVICTNENAATWSERLRPYAANGTVLIARLEGERQGWMPQNFWAWLREHEAHDPYW